MGVFLGMKVAAGALEESGHGSVINVSSTLGTSGGFGVSPAYAPPSDLPAPYPHPRSRVCEAVTLAGCRSLIVQQVRGGPHPAFDDIPPRGVE